jgi:hypothetical protein
MQILVRYEDLSSYERDHLLNGCGPSAIELVPELIFTDACNRHDFDYLVGGPKDCGDDSTWRTRAEDAFEKRLHEAASKESWYSRWWYHWAAWTYSRATRNLGVPSFTFRDAGAVVTLATIRGEHDQLRKKNGGKRPCAMVRALRSR